MNQINEWLYGLVTYKYISKTDVELVKPVLKELDKEYDLKDVWYEKVGNEDGFYEPVYDSVVQALSVDEPSEELKEFLTELGEKSGVNIDLTPNI